MERRAVSLMSREQWAIVLAKKTQGLADEILVTHITGEDARMDALELEKQPSQPSPGRPGRQASFAVRLASFLHAGRQAATLLGSSQTRPARPPTSQAAASQLEEQPATTTHYRRPEQAGHPLPVIQSVQ